MKQKLLLLLFLPIWIWANPKEVVDLPFYGMQDERYTIHSEVERFTSEKAVLINFTSSTCKPCKLEIPELLKLHAKLKENGLVLWIIFVGDGTKVVQSKIAELEIPDTIRVFKDPLSISYDRLNFNGVPATFLVNKDKLLITTSIGYTPAKFKQLQKSVEGSLK